MKIIQIIQPEKWSDSDGNVFGSSAPTVLGLGDDGMLYKWDWKHLCWNTATW